MRTLTLGLGVGMLAGVTMATIAINSMYPDVPRRMMRDGRRIVRTSKRAMGGILG